MQNKYTNLIVVGVLFSPLLVTSAQSQGHGKSQPELIYLRENKPVIMGGWVQASAVTSPDGESDYPPKKIIENGRADVPAHAENAGAWANIHAFADVDASISSNKTLQVIGSFFANVDVNAHLDSQACPQIPSGEGMVIGADSSMSGSVVGSTHISAEVPFECKGEDVNITVKFEDNSHVTGKAGASGGVGSGKWSLKQDWIFYEGWEDQSIFDGPSMVSVTYWEQSGKIVASGEFGSSLPPLQILHIDPKNGHGDEMGGVYVVQSKYTLYFDFDANGSASALASCGGALDSNAKGNRDIKVVLTVSK